MNDVTLVTLNWLCAERTLGAVKSLKKYYPDLPLLIIDDGSDAKDQDDFFKVYGNNPAYRAEVIYDPDTDKLKNIPGTEFIQVPTHRRHGESIDFAMKDIKTKWVLHMDSDARLVKDGVIDYMLHEAGDDTCDIGLEHIQKPGYPHVANTLWMFRADLANKHDLKMKPIYELGLETGHGYTKYLTERGYKVKLMPEDLHDYYVHLRYTGDNDEWNKYF